MRGSHLLLAGLLMVPSVVAVQAQTLQQQIDSVYAVQEQQDAARRSAWDARQAALRAQQRQEHAAERAQQEASAARQRARNAAIAAEQARNTSYEDKLRAQELEMRSLALKAEQTRIGRENDYIDAELARRKAETDVVQSNADANRELASGLKTYLGKPTTEPPAK